MSAPNYESSVPSSFFPPVSFIRIYSDSVGRCQQEVLHASRFVLCTSAAAAADTRASSRVTTDLQKGKKGHASCFHCDSRRKLNFRSFPTPSWTLDSTRRQFHFRISEKASDCHRSLSLSLCAN